MHPDTDPAPRCPHCAALEARVERLQLAVVRAHKMNPVGTQGAPSEIARKRLYGLHPGDLTDAAPERTGVAE